MGPEGEAGHFNSLVTEGLFLWTGCELRPKATTMENTRFLPLKTFCYVHSSPTLALLTFGTR